MKGKLLNLALVGCGDIAGSYLEAAKKSVHGRIVQVMDVNRALAEERGQACGAPATVNFEEVLANSKAQAVILSVPHYLHAPMTIQALESGKHVMCDKPIATTIADAEKMIATARRTGAKLTINYAMRFSDKSRYVRELIAAGLLGEVFAITIIAAGAKPESYWMQGWSKVTKTDWRKSKLKSGGGVTLMNVSHSIDLLFHLTGLSAVDGAGRHGTFNSPPGVEVEDLASGALRLRNGGIMTILASSCYAGGLPNCERVLGKNGQLDLATSTPETIRVFLNEAGQRGLKTHEWIEMAVPRSGRPGGYADLIDGFAEAVFNGAPAPVDPQDALHTLACVLSIYGENSRFPPGYGG